MLQSTSNRVAAQKSGRDMSKTIEFYFDVGSPTAYLAFTQLPALASRHGAQVEWRPVLLGGIFKAVGNRSPVEVIPKGRYMLEDLRRYAKRYGVSFRFNPHFPINTLQLMRGAAAIQIHEPPRLPDYIGTMFRALWVDEENMGDPAIVAKAQAASGFDAGQIASWCGDPAVKQKLIDDTNAAVGRGLFGVPTIFVSGAMFFGQDRLDFVEEALAA
jgi:2-hydroxychromene-2-carboxylate isomerase